MNAKRTISITCRYAGNVPVLMIEYGYKTVSMVAQNIGIFTLRTSCTYLRTSGFIESRYGDQAGVSPRYPEPSIEYLQQAYRDVDDLDYKTVILSPSLEVSYYLSIVLGVPVLPSRFITSAPNGSYVELNFHLDNLYIGGYEMDWPNLCVWSKPRFLWKKYNSFLERTKYNYYFNARIDVF